ncbi:MAG: MFS transporter [Candidatus Omnitrophica bacterium]|nr:MFS transporter [Candidatus Omnitrophota bacterium]
MTAASSFSPKAARSWALYDLANTIYSAGVVTVFLPLYITSLTSVNLVLGVTATCSMILAGLLAPPLGALTDDAGGTKRHLIVSTAITCAAVFCLALQAPLGFLLSLFAIAHFFYHLSLVYYNSLLPVVAPPERQGRVSGLGVGLGYAGVLLALPIGYAVEKYFGTRFTFPAVALLYFLGTIPLVLFVPERKVDNPKPFRLWLIGRELKETARTIWGLGAHPQVRNFFIANFFIQEAVNAAILWLSVFLKFTFGLSQGALILVLMGTNLFACLFGFAAGFATDRIGAFKMAWLAALSLSASFVCLMFIRNAYVALTALLIFGSLGLAGTWTAGRKLLIELSPEEKIGEYFGLYGLTTKLACFSMTAFAVIADRADFRAAIGLLAVSTALGLLFLTRAGKTC